MNLAQKYLTQHGITDETANDYDLTWDENYLYIPITDENGNESFTKSRYLHFEEDKSDQPKYKNSKGSKATLFNYYAVKDSKVIVLTEGEIDTIKLMQEGIPAASSTGGASTLPENFVENLSNKKVYICFDNDDAGREGTRKVLDLLPGAKVITLPEGVKDVCDFFVAGHDRAGFLELLKTAKTKQEWRLQHIPEDYKFISSNELIKMEFEQTPWLIEGVLYNKGFCFVYGAEGTGKSFITLSMAKAVATGTPWLGEFKTNQTNVLFIDKENPLPLIAKRSRGMEIATDNMYWLKQPHKFTLHDGKGGLSDFAYAVADQVEAHNIGLVVFDSLVDVMVGNSNSAEDTQVFFDAIKGLFTDISFLPIHHENKPAQGTYRNSAQRLRGSSNINAQAFTMFRLEAVNGSHTDLTLEQTKARDEQKLDKFLIRMQIRPNKAGNGTVVTGFEYIGVVAGEDTDKLSEAKEIISNAVASSRIGLSRQMILDVISSSGISQRTTDTALSQLDDEGKITKTRKGKQTWYISSHPIVEPDEDPRPFL